jgi:two-component system, sensor histidine kinase and response regulator
MLIKCKYKDFCNIQTDGKAFGDLLKKIVEDFCANNYTRCARYKVFKVKGVNEEGKKISPQDFAKASKLISESVDIEKRINEGKSVLIIDNKFRIMKMWEEMISRINTKEDVSLVRAANGQAALQQMLTKKFDLIITEYEMPIMGGVEFLKKIKANLSYKDIPAILITDKLKPEAQKNIENLGMSKVLYNPVDEKILFSSVNEVLENFISGTFAESSKETESKRVMFVSKDQLDLNLWDEVSETFQDKTNTIENVKVKNGQVAIQKLNAKKYDLLVTELDLPGITGQKMLELMRKGNINRDTCVLVITNKISENDMKSLLKYKIKKVLTKPFEKEILIENVNNILKG